MDRGLGPSHAKPDQNNPGMQALMGVNSLESAESPFNHLKWEIPLFPWFYFSPTTLTAQ